MMYAFCGDNRPHEPHTIGEQTPDYKAICNGLTLTMPSDFLGGLAFDYNVKEGREMPELVVNGNGKLLHPGVVAIMQHFEYDHLPEDLKTISKYCADLAMFMADRIDSDPELTVGLRKLLEAKDCFVRAARVTRQKAPARS